MSDQTFFLDLLRSPWGYMFAALWGALFGSFANVCIYRIPKHESILTPRSHCPACKRTVPAYDNIPLLSFLLLKGRCRFCNAQISIQYPAIELLSTLISLLLFFRFVIHEQGDGLSILTHYTVAFFFSLTLLILSAIDLAHRLLPNAITYPAIILFFALGRLTNWCSIQDGLISLLLGYGVIRLLADGYRLIKKQDGLGYGDGKLLAIVGGLLGFQCLFTTILLGSLLGSVIGIPWILIQRRNQKATTSVLHSALPFGPFLSVAAFISLICFAGYTVPDVLLRWLSPWFLGA